MNSAKMNKENGRRLERMNTSTNAFTESGRKTNEAIC